VTFGVETSIHFSLNILMKLLSEFPSTAKTLFSAKKKANVPKGVLQL
jgi:hypothetical protein